MTDPTRRRRYRYDRVVIEKARILEAQFDDAVLFFTGAQIELMRNMTEYLRRLETYCSDYHLGYYLTPTAEDYDSLMAIVASLEETLMGNDNVIWGYNDVFALRETHTKSGDGDYALTVFTVPAGYVYEVNVAIGRDTDSVATQVHYLHRGGFFYDINKFVDQPAGDWARSVALNYKLKEDDSFVVQFLGTLNGDALSGRCWGTMMIVP